jgi:hypothetical protein
MLNGAREVLDAWGFAPVTILTWAKDRMGLGSWLRGQTEHCILATRGKCFTLAESASTLLSAPTAAHSQKPEAFYALVERLCPAPRYAELFARRERPNWDGHGDEIAQQPKGARHDRAPPAPESQGERIDFVRVQWAALRGDHRPLRRRHHRRDLHQQCEGRIAQRFRREGLGGRLQHRPATRRASRP